MAHSLLDVAELLISHASRVWRRWSLFAPGLGPFIVNTHVRIDKFGVIALERERDIITNHGQEMVTVLWSTMRQAGESRKGLQLTSTCRVGGHKPVRSTPKAPHTFYFCFRIGFDWLLKDLPPPIDLPILPSETK